MNETKNYETLIRAKEDPKEWRSHGLRLWGHLCMAWRPKEEGDPDTKCFPRNDPKDPGAQIDG